MSSPESPPIALSIAGSDSGGGAGIQADLKTFAALGAYGTCVVTAITAQNTLGISDLAPVPLSTIRSQFRALKEDLPHAAAKTGMLHDAEIVEAVASLMGRPPKPLVVDPVLMSSSGRALMDEAGIEAYRRRLIPLASILTPNLDEAARLLGLEPIADAGAMRQACKALMDFGCRSVYLKGGHLPGEDCLDLFFDGAFIELSAPRIHTPNTHGTGCTLSAALTACLAKGMGLRDSAHAAKHYLTRALASGATRRVGSGHGPLDHFPAA